MKKINLLSVFLLASFLVITSCSKNNDEPDDVGGTTTATTVKEDKENIKANMNSFYSCLETLADGGFSDLLYNSVVKEDIKTVYTGPWGSYTDSESWISFVMDKLGDSFGPVSKNNGFNFLGLKGKYAWNINDKKWERVSDADIIELKFPSIHTGTTNNAVIVVDNYDDIEFTYLNKELKLPTKGHVLVTIDGVRTAELTIKDVVYDINTNFSIPLKAEIEFFTKPFTNTIKFNRISPTKFDFTFNMSSDTNCGYTFNTELELNTSDYGNISSIENDVKKVKGYFAHDNMKVKFSFDVTKVKALGKKMNELSTNEINTILDSELLYNDIKISDVTIDDKAEFLLNMTFKDGTKESGKIYFGDFVERIEEIAKKFLN